MKILIHDFAGHPFQMVLSRELAKRGHSVTHAYFAGDEGPKGDLRSESFDSGGQVTVEPIGQVGGYTKTDLPRRFLADLAYRRHVHTYLSAQNYDVIISGNTPLWVQGVLLRAARRMNAGFVYWCQDVYSVAVSQHLEARFGSLSHPFAWWLKRWDRRLMRASDHLVNITDKFSELTEAWGVPASRTTVIPNWGAISSLPMVQKNNAWSRDTLPNSERPRVLYSGTLGLKHNPGLIIDAAKQLAMEFVVIGSGSGVDRIAQAGLPNLCLLPLQPFDRMAEVLGSADVLVAVIEREAGEFSVPSKVLSYLCAGRPIVLAAPQNNLAASIVKSAGAGLVVEPEDAAGFTQAIQAIVSDPGKASIMGRSARDYAEQHFSVDRVSDRFEAVFASVAKMS